MIGNWIADHAPLIADIRSAMKGVAAPSAMIVLA
jgi:hypothetical protein